MIHLRNAPSVYQCLGRIYPFHKSPERRVIRQWVTTQVVADDTKPTFTYPIDHEALHRWGEQHWGKTILFTDHDDGSTAELIAAYRDARPVESTFRDLKQPLWIRWQPQCRWTDDKIRVHGLICVLAVTLAHLLRREYARAGLDLSLPRLLQELTTIQEVAWLYPQSRHAEPQGPVKVLSNQVVRSVEIHTGRIVAHLLSWHYAYRRCHLPRNLGA